MGKRGKKEKEMSWSYLKNHLFLSQFPLSVLLLQMRFSLAVIHHNRPTPPPSRQHQKSWQHNTAPIWAKLSAVLTTVVLKSARRDSNVTAMKQRHGNPDQQSDNGRWFVSVKTAPVSLHASFLFSRAIAQTLVRLFIYCFCLSIHRPVYGLKCSSDIMILIFMQFKMREGFVWGKIKRCACRLYGLG